MAKIVNVELVETIEHVFVAVAPLLGARGLFFTRRWTCLTRRWTFLTGQWTLPGTTMDINQFKTYTCTHASTYNSSK